MESTEQMTEEEVVQFMRETFKIRIKQDDLVKPTYESVFSIYSHFLSEFGMDNVAQPDLEACRMVYFDQYDEFIPSINLVQTIHGLVGTETNPIRLADLRLPSRRRTMMIINRLIGIWINLVELKSDWEKVKVNYAQYPESIKIAEGRISELRTKNEHLSAELTRAKPNGQKIREQIRSKAATLEESKSKAAVLQEEIRHMKTEVAQHEETKSSLMIERDRITEEISNTEQNVIRSPQKIISLTHEKSNQLEERRTTKREVGKEFNQILKEIDQKNKMGSQLTTVLDTMKGVFEDLTIIREKCDMIDSMDQNIVSKELTRQELKRVVGQRQKSATALREQFTNIRTQNASRVAAMRDELNNAKEVLEVKMSQQNSTDLKMLEEERSLLKQITNIEVTEQQAKSRAKERRRLIDNKSEGLADNWRNKLSDSGFL